MLECKGNGRQENDRQGNNETKTGVEAGNPACKANSERLIIGLLDGRLILTAEVARNKQKC